MMTQATTIFPSLDIQILCCVLCLLGMSAKHQSKPLINSHVLALTLLTHLVSRRITIENVDSFSSIAFVSAARICLCLVFIDSWIFVFTSKCLQQLLVPISTWGANYSFLLGALLLFGIGLERSTKMCSLGIILCLMFYASSKALIYAFLG